MANKQEVRPIYSELQGCLAQAPSAGEGNIINNAEFWEHHNNTIQELNKLTGKDYMKYSLAPMRGYDSAFITVAIYRQKLGGLIARLHGEYFSDEQVPFAEMPSTVIQQNQNQSQSVQIEFMLEVSNLINDKLHAAKEGSKEKSFLEKVRGSLGAVKNVGQLITLLLATANQMGISIEELKDLF